MRANPFLVTIALLSLLASGLVAPLSQAQSGFDLPESFDDALEDEGIEPRGDWERALEKVTFFLDSDEPFERTETQAGEVETVPRGIIGYYHYEPPQGVVEPVEVDTGTPAGTVSPGLDPDDPDDKRVIISEFEETQSEAVFQLPRGLGRYDVTDDLSPTRPFQVYGVEGTLYVSCASENVGVDAGVASAELVANSILAELRTRLHNEDGTDGGWKDYSSSSGRQDFMDNLDVTAEATTAATGSQTVFRVDIRGVESLGNFQLGNGHRGEVFDPQKMSLEFAVQYNFQDLTSTLGSCVLHYGSQNFPSNFRLVTDTATLNTWIEDRDGRYTVGLPSAEDTSQEQRRMTAAFLQASAWPDLNRFQHRLDDPVDYMDQSWLGMYYDSPLEEDPSETHYADLDMGDDQWFLRWFHPAEDRVEYDTRTGDSDQTNTRIKPLGARQSTPIGSSLNADRFDFLYTAALPDGEFHYEVYNDARTLAASTRVTVGLKDFEMGLVDSRGPGATVHEVELGEETTFLLELRNVGAQADSIALSTTNPGTGWTVELGVDAVALPAGSTGPDDVGVTAPVTVTPSATAKVGDERSFTVTARSSFPEEVEQRTLELTVRVVAPENEDVELFNVRPEVSVSPGASFTLSGLRVHNLGSRADTYLLEAQLPVNAPGWTARATPPARLVAADSVETFSLEVNVPADAPNGQTIPLPVTARLVGDDSVVDTVIVLVHVILEHRLDFSVSSNLVPMRTPIEECLVPRDEVGGEAAETCTIDSKSDRSALYRLRFTNDGPVDETYTLRGDWEGGSFGGQSVSGISSGGCDSSPPDHWRLDYGSTHDDSASGSPHRDPRILETFAVPAGQTVTRWIEMGYNWPFGANLPLAFCNTPDQISGAAAYRLVATVDSAPGQKVEHTIAAYRLDSDLHAPVLEPELDPLTNTFTQDQESELIGSTQEFEQVTYPFRVRNEATEHGSISVTVPPGAGFEQHLEFVGSPLSAPSCTSRDTTDRTFVCRDLGVHGEAVFNLVVQPDAGVLNVDSRSLQHVITAISTDGGDAASLGFTTDLVGEFQFDARAIVDARKAHPGQEVSLPFQILNQGSRDDTFTISLLEGDPDWRPRLSTDDAVFVAGEHNLEGFLRVQVPETAAADDSETFRLQISGSDVTKGVEDLTYRVTVIEDAGIVVQGVEGDQVLIEGRGQQQSIEVEAIDPAAELSDPITFRVHRANLPEGWTVAAPIQTGAVEADTRGRVAQVAFSVTAPEDGLGTSSVPLIVEACRGDQQDCGDDEDFIASGDIILNLQDDVGVFMRLEDPDVITATLPGGDVVLPVLVQNAGLSADIIDLSNTQAKDGWSIRYDPPVLSLAPLESRVVDVIVSTPTNADPGETMDFLLFGTSRSDASAFSQLQLRAEIGVFGLEWSTQTPSAALGPGESYSFVASIHNNGTLPDTVIGTGGFGSPTAQEAYGSLVNVHLSPSSFEIGPGDRRDVVVTVELATSVPPAVTIPVQALFESIPDNPSEVAPTFDVKVLDYRAEDVDGDGIAEFAVDRNQDAGDGFEDFLDPDPSAGIHARPAQLVRFLSDEGRLQHTVKMTQDNQTVDVVVLRIDGDPATAGFGDGKVDLFLDDTGDGLPNIYWDPDDGHASRLSVLKDINADGVPDYFVDTDGNGEFNAVYDLAQGTFVRLLVRDVDNDGNPDFVVDKNGNGRADGDETVLFAREGKLIQVTKVDVDGDGKLDDVFDTDGDGNPDYFVPNGKTKGVPLSVDRDLNQDGFLDWSYDANRDGRDDHFYDPAAQSGGHTIDARAEFVRNLQEFWYVGALFILVAALFVVLVAVTRR